MRIQAMNWSPQQPSIDTPFPSVTDALCQEIVQRVLSVGTPLKVVLFGSRARGTHKPYSDIDLLVIEKEYPLPKKRKELYNKALHRVYPEYTLLVESLRTVEQWKHVPSHILSEALRQGRVLYEDETGFCYELEQVKNLFVAEEAQYKTSYDLAQEWLNLADRDIKISQILIDNDGPPEGACFHVQQAIEKYLKGLRALHEKPDMKTHDLEQLFKDCQEIADAKSTAEITEDQWKRISSYAVEGRYSPTFTADLNDVEEALSIAQNIRKVLTDILDSSQNP